MANNGFGTGSPPKDAVSFRDDLVDFETDTSSIEEGSEPGPETPADLVERVTDLMLGIGEVLYGALRDVVGDPSSARTDSGARRDPGVVALVPGALVGLGLEAERRIVRASRTVMERARDSTSRVATLPFVARPFAALESGVRTWYERGTAGRRRRQIAVDQLVREMAGAIVSIVVDELDVDAVIARTDLNAVTNNLDLDRVIDRVDVDAVVSRVDVEAILGRVDLARIARDVIDEIELPEIIRESTGEVTVDAVDSLRRGGKNADRFVARVVDRMLGRKDERDLGPPGNGMLVSGAEGTPET